MKKLMYLAIGLIALVTTSCVEQTQSYVEGKRQTALKYYKEYMQSDENSKQGLKNIISQDFANFDEDKYLTGELRDFIYKCKYGVD